MLHIARGAVLLLCWVALSAAGQQVLAGRSLEDALRLLQRAGLSIVFSSEVVTPRMRVVAEPRGSTLRQQLDEILAPHNLKAEDGPGQLILIVPNRSAATREPAARPRASSRTDAGDRGPSPSSHDAATYTDRVTVWGVSEEPVDRSGSGTTLRATAVRAATSVLADDGLEAVHAMPSVVADDDARSEFSVRGSPYRQIGIVIDGVATPWLQHTIYGRNDAGSLSMFAGDIVDRLTLQSGAYPRRYDDNLGSQVEVDLKDGSRESTRVNARAGGTSAGFAAEGPIGSDGRGSWVAGVRNSYRSWPPLPLSPSTVAFAFTDMHAKLVYDVSPTQQVRVTALGGRSALDTVDEPLVGPLGAGTDRAGLVSLAWRSTLGARTVAFQRVSFIGQDLVSALPTGELAGRSTNRALDYRGEVVHAMFGGLFEAGANLARTSGSRNSDAAPTAFGATWLTDGAYVNFAHAAPRGLSFESGLRLSDSTLVHHPAAAPWIRGAWRFNPAWSVTASAGASRQFPSLEAVLGRGGSSTLVPERATLIDVGVEQRLASMRWQVTLFNRRENDILRLQDLQPRLEDGVLRDPSRQESNRNSLSGSTRGLELVVTPYSTGRLSGWTSYTFATAHQTDDSTRETFSSDFDRRHTLNAAGTLRVGRQSTVGLVFRAASGVPIPGYFDLRNGMLFAGERRNATRLPAYARLDARVQRTFFAASHAVTVFGEALNVMNRSNQGLTDGVVQPGTGEAIGFVRPLLHRTVSFGIDVSLRR